MVTADAAAIVPTDEELGARFAAGDPTAIDDLYVRWKPRILQYVLGKVRDRAVAEDITQTTFVRAIEEWTSLRDPAKVRSWLYTIALNLVLQQLRRRRRQADGDVELLAVVADNGPEDATIGRATQELVWKAATSLSVRQYTVLTLMLREKFTSSEIADVLGVSTNHAHQLEHRAKTALRNAVGTIQNTRRADRYGSRRIT